jgi:hypothetical protein
MNDVRDSLRKHLAGLDKGDEMIERLAQMKRLVGDMEWMINRNPEPSKERWFLDTKSMTVHTFGTPECQTAALTEPGYIEITAEQKAYLETKPEPVEGFEWVLKVPEITTEKYCAFVSVQPSKPDSLNGIRWTQVPVKVEHRFVEYDIHSDGMEYYCVVPHAPCKSYSLSQLPNIVGFTGDILFRDADGSEQWRYTQIYRNRDGLPSKPIKALFYITEGLV